MSAPAPLARMVRSQARFELRLALRNGEQLLLMLVIPIGLLLLLSQVEVVDIGTSHRIDFVTPGVLSLAVLSTAFTSLAIATGFERRYGALKRLGATPLPRSGLLAGKALAVLTVEAAQFALIGGLAAALGWSPHGLWPAAVALAVLATIAFVSLGLLMAGTMRAEATLAGANLLFLVLLLSSGISFPLSRLPSGVEHAARLLPSTALTDGLRAVLQDGDAVPLRCWLVLVVWALAGVLAAARWFRWD
ncbi:MAG: type transport system permease protein [Frankiales bacterium]|nr:type transport system permease protein [Frankiales bacterium]